MSIQKLKVCCWILAITGVIFWYIRQLMIHRDEISSWAMQMCDATGVCPPVSLIFSVLVIASVVALAFGIRIAKILSREVVSTMEVDNGNVVTLWDDGSWTTKDLQRSLGSGAPAGNVDVKTDSDGEETVER